VLAKARQLHLARNTENTKNVPTRLFVLANAILSNGAIQPFFSDPILFLEEPLDPGI
jgi:hypothetical protein